MSHKKRPSIGNDPLDGLIPSSPQTTTTPKVEPTLPPRERKARATFHIPEDLFEEARDAAVQLAGPPLRLTLADLATRGIRAELERLKREYNGGKPFPKRQSNLKGGRPIGT